MKYILLLISAVTLLTTAGCIFPDHRGRGDYHERGEHRGHAEYRGHPEYHNYPEPGVTVRVHAE